MDETTPRPVTVPDDLVESLTGFFGADWVRSLPLLAARRIDRWELTVTGAPMHGAIALVLPVRRPDGTDAVLKLQPLDEETAGEPIALRAWDGDGAVRLLDHDPEDGSLLLEALDSGRDLDGLPLESALEEIGALLARLSAHPAPPGLRDLGEVTRDIVVQGRRRLREIEPEGRPTFAAWIALADELAGEAGDRLIHWDLHYDNVLAPRPGEEDPRRGAWLAIDPKPLAGDPGFDLLPALRNRWEEAERSGDPVGAVRRRFDVLTSAAGLDRDRARAWTRVRMLQDCLWMDEGRHRIPRRYAAVESALESR
ncbi:aminoglycoside phosphotransferase family protein [Nocardiopsis alba]|uniref:aminoglycoside phosphotransferase family protein n=1 Tax=Nocardiopsis alba TaxID=53437 RepID=UPI0036B9E74B